MKLSCHNRLFNSDWDLKLKWLIENHVSFKTGTHTIAFKVLRKKRLLLPNSYDYYEVWTRNKHCAYGYLIGFNGEKIEDEYQFSASQETLIALYKLEAPFPYDTVYGIPK